MGRKSIADKILEDLNDTNRVGSFLLVYDFSGKKAKEDFYKNLKRLFEHFGDGVRVQKSTIRLKSLKAARAIKVLATHYGADVLIFEGKEVE